MISIARLRSIAGCVALFSLLAIVLLQIGTGAASESNRTDSKSVMPKIISAVQFGVTAEAGHSVTPTAVATTAISSAFTSLAQSQSVTEDGGTTSSVVPSTKQHCHFHAGVEHCSGVASGESSPMNCAHVDRQYNIPLRVGLLFVVLIATAFAVFLPIVLASFLPPKANIFFTVLKQFGTGVIVSTAFVHLFTHATLMFGNECLGELEYEATASAILMGGLFSSFLVSSTGQSLVEWTSTEKTERISESPRARKTQEMVNMAVLEAGILFHSLLIGLTLVAAADTFFLTLSAVILVHQTFEGIALGSRIASLGRAESTLLPLGSHCHAHTLTVPLSAAVPALGHESTKFATSTIFRTQKFLLAGAFALVTPLGMAIGIGVLHRFNGNDPMTLVAIGTLDAFSAGILAWVGVVDMWARDWVMGGEMVGANLSTKALGMFGLVAGMALMSVLGKWA